MSTHLFVTDQHAHAKHNNRRAEYLGHLINDLRPDVVVFGGDLADMPSLSSYDKGKKAFQGRTYRADIDAANDFLDRCWGIVRRAKKRMPRRIALEGNHEERIRRAINIQPELEGTIDLKDIQFENYFDEFVPYQGTTPGIITVDGIHYSHYFVSGNLGRPLGGEHPAATLLAKQGESCSAGHSHLADVAIRTAASGRKRIGLVGGCFQDYDADWAGASNRLWWRGCVLKRNVDRGMYDFEFISLDRMKKEYG